MRFGIALVCAATTAALLAGAVGEAHGRAAAPTDLTVVGGEETWRPSRDFGLRWRNPETFLQLVAVEYLIRDPLGAAVVEGELAPDLESIGTVRVPNRPGIYTFEVWVRDAVGMDGAHAAASLRFDDARPPATAPLEVDRWVGEADLPLGIRIAHPQGPLPISGIRGYAVSIDEEPEGRPCAGATLCADAETDLRGGIDGDVLEVAELEEGINQVHAVAVSGSGVGSAEVGTSVLKVDRTYPATVLVGAPGGWTNRSVEVVARTTDRLSGMDSDAGAFTAIRIDGGAPTIAPGETARASVIDEGVHRVAHYARDAAGNVADGVASNGVANPAPAVTMVRIDRAAPSVAFAAAQDPRDPELIVARVADELAGASDSRGSIGVRPLGSGDRFDPLPTVAVGDVLRARWSSESYPPGRYEFRAIGFDAAGNSSATTSRSDGAPMVLANPLKTTTELDLGFGGPTLIWHRCERRGGDRRCRRETISGFERRPATRVVPYGRGALLSGRLLDGGGAPIAGAPVRVLERSRRGPRRVERIEPVRTDPTGRFSIRVDPGPSREISAGFEGSRTLNRSASRVLRLRVRSALRLRVSSQRAVVGGRPVVFSGRVLDPASIPGEGKTVSLQFRLTGMPWTEFRTIRTDRRGRFRHAYRFSDDDSRGVRFQFRAHAPAEAGWPYEPGTSNQVAVTGT